ncbi:hypothetical protein K5E_04700 [Enterococcus thailandicus]|nr:hypothetical protein K4E_13820 [Enterococcus thailandicus]GMC08332.1 hypothetical protein K5E_04700 [Enterococcus thailandicus]
MVEKVFSYYLNKRLGLVPVQTVEEILGMKLDSVGKETSLVG